MFEIIDIYRIILNGFNSNNFETETNLTLTHTTLTKLYTNAHSKLISCCVKP